jgi:hypothetical protein
MIPMKCEPLCDHCHPEGRIREIHKKSYCIPDEGFGESFLTDGFTRIKVTIIAPAIIPHSRVMKMTIARDASKLQKRNVIAAGTAF